MLQVISISPILPLLTHPSDAYTHPLKVDLTHPRINLVEVSQEVTKGIGEGKTVDVCIGT